jgi:hypothetical protein
MFDGPDSTCDVLRIDQLPACRPTGHGAGGRSLSELDADLVVHRGPNSPFASEVSLGGLDREMPEEKLNLF